MLVFNTGHHSHIPGTYFKVRDTSVSTRIPVRRIDYEGIIQAAIRIVVIHLNCLMHLVSKARTFLWASYSSSGIHTSSIIKTTDELTPKVGNIKRVYPIASAV